MLLLLTGLSVASLPTILLYVLIFVVFLALLYWILSVVPPTAAYARTITLIVGGIILLLFLISLVGGKSLF